MQWTEIRFQNLDENITSPQLSCPGPLYPILINHSKDAGTQLKSQQYCQATFAKQLVCTDIFPLMTIFFSSCFFLFTIFIFYKYSKNEKALHYMLKLKLVANKGSLVA